MGVARLGIVGSGIMGAGIAECTARAGIDVVLRSRKQETADATFAGARAVAGQAGRAGPARPGRTAMPPSAG